MREIGMISDLKPYQEIKYSGSKWFEVVPEHWKARTLWSLSRLRVERNPGDLPLLSIFLDQGVIMHKDDGGQTHAPSLDLSNYQVVHPGDLVLNNQQAWRGSVGVSTYHGIISPAYIVLELSEEFLPGFANYVSRCPVMVDQYVTASKGVGDIQRQIYWPYLREVKVPLPPTIEQSAIIRFLDYMDRRIRRYIRTKQKLIRLLEEQKQAIIHRAVSRGLDPSVPLKPSGVEWLGEVPEHWEVKRCRYLFREIDDRSFDGSEEHLSMSQRLGLVPNYLVENNALLSESYAGGKLCDVGDLVLNRLKAHLGVFALARYHGVISPDYTVLRPIDPESAAYFEAVLRSPACRPEFRIRAKGIVEGFWRLYTDDFYDIRLPLPPSSERHTIILFVQNAVSEIDRISHNADCEISLLREYRARLISDVVTGKLDVRGANLPAAEEVEAPEEYTDLLESEEITEEDLQEEIPAEGDLDEQ